MLGHLLPGQIRPGIAHQTIRLIRDWWGEKPLSQAAFLVAIALLLSLLGQNTVDNMHRFGLTPGFGFLDRTAGFEIGESWIDYSGRDSFGRAIVVGLLNTIEIGVLGCLLATILGVVLGFARLSANPLLSSLVRGYVDLVRNTPLLLQLFFWNLTVHALPPPRQALAAFGGLFLTNRGIYFPWLSTADGGGIWPWAIAIGLGLAALVVWRRRGGWLPTIGLTAAAAAVLALSGGWPQPDLPHLQGFNIQGGRTISPEFASLLVGMAVNASAAIAESVRAGIQAVPAGQWEAARALGLSPGSVLRQVVFPQALRVIIPLITSTYVALTKQSSIAVAIGFPDLVNVLNTTANQSGQALEAILIMLAVYLSLSLGTSVAMNIYNHRLAQRGGQRP